ncbi:MAG: C45 family autoproteolytic acyltransferase/hydrolase [Candidatus Helarchaeales archaeon]
MKKKYAALLILILIMFGFGLAYFWLDKFEVSTKVVTITGYSHYELGLTYGIQCRQEIQAFQSIIGIADILVGMAGFSSTQQFIEQMEPYVPPYLLQEMNGVADGAGVPNSTIFLINAFADLLNFVSNKIPGMACTQFIFTNKTATTAGPIYGRNLDYFPNHILDNFQVVLRIFPPDGKAVIGHTIAGMVGLLGGMNSEGVCVSVSLVNTPEVGLGIPCVLAIRDALNYADNSSIGTAILNGTHPISDGRTHQYQNQTSGWIYGVLDSTGMAAFVETTNQNSFTRWEGKNGEPVGYMSAANHFTTNAMKSHGTIPTIVSSSLYRKQTMDQLMAMYNATQQFGPYEAMCTLRNQWDPLLGFNLGGQRSIDNLDLYTMPIPSGSMASFIMCPLLNYTLVTLCQPSFGDFYQVGFEDSNAVVGPIF